MTNSRGISSKRADLSQLDYTLDLISCLSVDELEAVQKIAIVFLNKKKENKSTDNIVPFQKQTEEDILLRVDHSIAQIDSAYCEDLEDVYKEMMSEIDE